MENIPQDKQELFNLCDLRRLLAEDTPTALVAPKGICRLHRQSECVMPAAGVQLVFDAQFSKPISRLPVTHFNTIIQVLIPQLDGWLVAYCFDSITLMFLDVALLDLLNRYRRLSLTPA